MQTVWQFNKRKSLLLFFTGWGMDERPTTHLSTAKYDVCTCFNYNSLHTHEAEQWKQYETITVAAWSMGVWAAEQVWTQAGLPVKRAVAINGTPKPVDDTQGIPPAMAQATLDTLTPESLKRFYRRMLGSGNLLKQMEESGRMPDIDFDERKEELHRIIGQKPYPETGFTWNKAVIGTNDAIFPVPNMRTAWQGKAEIIDVDAPHYPFHLFKTWEEITGE